jgi:hypothetical protein
VPDEFDQYAKPPGEVDEFDRFAKPRDPFAGMSPEQVRAHYAESYQTPVEPEYAMDASGLGKPVGLRVARTEADKEREFKASVEGFDEFDRRTRDDSIAVHEAGALTRKTNPGGWTEGPQRAREFLAGERASQEALAEEQGLGLTVGRALMGPFAGLKEDDEHRRLREMYGEKHWQARVGTGVADAAWLGVPARYGGQALQVLGVGKLAANTAAAAGTVAALTPGDVATRAKAGLDMAGMSLLAGPVTRGLAGRNPGFVRETLAGGTGFAVGGAAVDPNLERAPEHFLTGAILHAPAGIGKMRAEAAKPKVELVDVAPVPGEVRPARAESVGQPGATVEMRTGPAETEGRGFLETFGQAKTGQPIDAYLYRREVKGRRDPGTGTFFTTGGVDKAWNNEKAGDLYEGARVRERVALSNPLVIGTGAPTGQRAHAPFLNEAAKAGSKKAELLLEKVADPETGLRDIKAGVDLYHVERVVAAEARRMGYDGIVNRDLMEVVDLRGAKRPEGQTESVGAGASVVASPTERGSVGVGPSQPTPPPGAPKARGFLGDVAADFRRVFGSMTERLGASGGPVAREARARAEAAIEAGKKHAGAYSAEADAVLRDAGRMGGPARGLGAFRFEKGKDYATAPIVEIGEGRMAPRNQAEADLMKKMGDFVMRRGRQFEAVGTKRVNPETGEVEPFVAAKNVMPRVLHTEGMDVIRSGKGPAWDALTRGIAEMNNVPLDRVREVLNKRRDSLGSGEESADVEAHAEHFRMWRRFPAAVRVGSRVVPILETNAYNYARGLAVRGAQRMGVIEAIGQDIGADRPLADLQRRFRQETGDDKPFVQAMRALHGAPVTDPLLTPGTRKSAVARGARAVGDVVKEGALSLTAVPNVTEPLGNVFSMGGVRDFIKGTAKQFAFGSKARARGLQELEVTGARDAQIWNRTSDPSRPMTGWVRPFKEAAGRAALGRKYVEEAGGTNAGFVAREVRARMQRRAGKGPSVGAEADTFTLRRLGFKPEDARRIAGGGGTAAEYDTFLRRATSRLIGENMAPAELSRMEHSRLYQSAFAFQRFANMNIRDTARVFDTAARSYAEAFKDRNFRQAVATTSQVAKWATGKAVSNATATLLMSLLTGGTTGLKIKWEEAEGDIAKFLGASFVSSLLAGNYGAVLRATQGSQDLEDAIFPVAVFKEAVDAFQGDGRYRNDIGGWERVGSFLERFAPLNRPFTTGAIAQLSGTQEEADRMRLAQRDFWGWYRDNKVGRDIPDIQPSDYTKVMRKAYGEVLRGRHAEAERLVAEALALPDPTIRGRDVVRSLKSRMLLTKPGVAENIESLKRRETTYGLVQAHDRVLGAYIDALESDPNGRPRGGQ